MSYRGFRMGGGLNTKATGDVVADNQLVGNATGCSFDEVGAVQSARGRSLANNGAVINSADDVLGGFDGFGGASISTLKKYRFIKAGANVYTNTTTSTALDDSTNLTATYTTSVGTLVNKVRGLTAPTWSSGNHLSGFTYGGYAYAADGQATQRFALATGAPPTVTANTWGLESPGFHYLTAAPITTDSTGGSPTGRVVTCTISTGHGLGLGMAASPTYPYTMSIELFGVEATGGVLDNHINCLHSGYSGGSSGNVTVTSSGGTMAAGATYTIEFKNELALTGYPPINIVSPTGGLANLDQTLGHGTGEQDGSSTQNEIQKLEYTGSNATSGYFRLDLSRHDGSGDWFTGNLAFDCTTAQMLTALQDIPWIGGNTAVNTTCSVTSATAFTFVVPTAASSSTTGGGVIGFMRQGPTLAVSAGGGLASGTYYYAYTFYNGVAESNFSAQCPVDASASDKCVLTNILMGPVGTTERRIYRTDVNGRQLYYIGKLRDNTTLTFTDLAGLAPGADPTGIQGTYVTDQAQPGSSTDVLGSNNRAPQRGVNEAETAAKAAADKKREKLPTNLGLLSAWTDHDPAPAGLYAVGLVGDTAFGIDIDGNLRFSKPGEVEHWPLSNSVRPPRGVSDYVTAWLPFDKDVIIYTKNGLYRFSALGLSFEDARLEEIESPVGLASEFGVAALDGQAGHLFLAKSGIYLFDGARVTEVSYPIEKLFTDSANQYYIQPTQMVQSFLVTSRDRMYLAYRTTAGAGDNNRLLLGDFQDPSDPKFTVMARGYTSLWREKADNYLMAGTAGSYLYVEDQGWTDNGGTIVWTVGTKDLRLNGTQTMFSLDEVVVDADFNGATATTVYVYVEPTSNGDAYKETTFTIDGSAYPYRKRYRLKLPVYFKGTVAYVVVSSTHAGKRALYEVGFTYTTRETEP